MSGSATSDASDGSAGAQARNRRLWTVAIFLTMACTGAVMQVRGAVLPTLEGYFTVPEWQLGLVAPAGTVGYLLVILAVGSSAGRVDARRFIAGGAALTGGALIAMGLAPSFPVFLGALAVQGAAVGVFRALDRPLLSHFYPNRRGQALTVETMVWAVGATIGPLLVFGSLMIGSWRLTYAFLAVATFGVAIAIARLESPVQAWDEQALARDDVLSLLRRPTLLLMALTLVLVGGIESVFFTWLPYYTTEFFSRGVANLTLSVYLAAYIPGRLAFSVVAEKYSPPDAVFASALVLAVLLTALLSVQSHVLPRYILATFLVGLLVSGLFPMLLTWGVEVAPRFTGPINALALVASQLGFLIVPPTVGLLADRYSIGRALLVQVGLACGLSLLLGVRRVVSRQGREQTADQPTNES